MVLDSYATLRESKTTASWDSPVYIQLKEILLIEYQDLPCCHYWTYYTLSFATNVEILCTYKYVRSGCYFIDNL